MVGLVAGEWGGLPLDSDARILVVTATKMGVPSVGTWFPATTRHFAGNGEA